MMKGYDCLARLSRHLSDRYLPTVMATEPTTAQTVPAIVRPVDLFTAAQEDNRGILNSELTVDRKHGVGNRGEKSYSLR
jgi:hypothetical protein